MASLLKGLSEEKVVLLNPSRAAKLPFPLKGVVRLVQATTGETLAVLLGRETLEEIEEDLESLNPAFLSSLGRSRASGHISGKSVKKKIKRG